jgi:hypothetical protein
MAGVDERVTHSEATHVSRLGETARTAASGQRGMGILLALALVVFSGIIAPGDAPGTWSWVGVLLAALLAAFAIATIAGVRDRERAPQLPSPILTWGTLILAILISLSFSVLTAALAVIILAVLLFHVSGVRSSRSTVFWLLTIALTPLWVWSAFDAWDRWLLMLVPLGAVGMVALEHALRADLAPASELAERYAAWIGVTLIGAALLLTVLLSDIDPTWVIGGTLATVLLAAVDLVLPTRLRDRVPSFTVPGAALLALAFSWLTAL